MDYHKLWTSPVKNREPYIEMCPNGCNQTKDKCICSKIDKSLDNFKFKSINDVPSNSGQTINDYLNNKNKR